MYGYRCIVTPKNVCVFVPCFLRVAPGWNFEIMSSSLPIKLHSTQSLRPKSLKIDLAVYILFQTPLTIKNSPSLGTVSFCRSSSAIYNIRLGFSIRHYRGQHVVDSSGNSIKQAIEETAHANVKIGLPLMYARLLV